MDSKTELKHGAREVRLEDDALVRGNGRFVDDARFPNQSFAVFVRSPHAHAKVVSVDTAEAAKAKGVLAVLTAEDMKGLATAGKHPPLPGRGGAPLIQPFRPVLAGERVRYVGEAVAMVVAETLGQAQDGAELVNVSYEELSAVVDPREAAKDGAPQLHAEAKNNVALDWPGMIDSPEHDAQVDEIIKTAPHVARVDVHHQRIATMSMETRGANARYDAKTDSYDLRACSQSASVVRNQTAPVLIIEPAKLRVTTEDVGGAFGM
jgi:carbon-monoxide dehydrogenase large subunit